MDSTIKPTNRIQCQFDSKADSAIKPRNRFQCQFHSKTDSTIKNPEIGFNVNSIQRQIQPLKTLKYDSMSIPFKDGLNH